MKVFKIHQGYRKLGINYGLPVFYIDCGYGSNLDVEKILKTLIDMGLGVNQWVVIRRAPLKERDIKAVVDGLKACKVSVEIEEDGLTKDPLWFSAVDRWVVTWREPKIFNYNAMRPGRDMIIYKQQGDLTRFLSQDYQGIKGILGNQKAMWDIVKGEPVRVYNLEEERETW